MADLQDMRARMRDTGYQAAPSKGSGNLGFWLIAVAAAGTAFAAVQFAPRFYSARRTVAAPVSHAVATQAAPSANANAATAQVPTPGNLANYAGKSPDEMAEMADAVCTQHARPSRVLSSTEAQSATAHGANLTDDNERLRCLLTEAPARYCSASQRSHIAANVINYFKAIEYKNVAISLAARMAAVTPEVLRGTSNSAPAAMPGMLLVDPLVIEGVEGLLRGGYLLKAQREDIGSNVPRDIKERLARVVAIASPCPKPPWWAVWK